MHANKFQEQDKLKAFPVESDDLGMPFKEIFDFIIVGGGTSGCILARRLVDANFKVLLLEAGGNPPPLLDVPFVNSFIQNHSNSDLDIMFQQVSVQKITAGLPKYNPKS
ncbi:unnamed protein product [Allacma fusca]|uniref:Glucose-methanol-choline oxidoreductase N-terminal domain-containing protein n=1 Tax=Allacma fusca TaxID=39272 RepID=A0A8J2KJZ7_9HEXA|nr:unnamed protein product [Allacma fusca]